jgi:hypothetical protein
MKLSSYPVWSRLGYAEMSHRFVVQLGWFGWVCGTIKEIWRLDPLCLMWCLWCERNARHFEDVETSLIDLRKLMLNTLHLWIAAHHNLSVSTFADFLNLCSSLSSY